MRHLTKHKKHLSLTLIFTLVFALILPKPAKASGDLYDIAVTPASPTNVNAPIITGQISAGVAGVLVTFHNISYPDNSHDYAVAVTLPDPYDSTFTTEHDPFSPLNPPGGSAEPLLPDGTYQISVQVDDAELNELDRQTLPSYYIIDTLAPAFVSARFTTDTNLEVLYSEPLQSIDYTKFASTTFTAAAGNITDNFANIAINPLNDPAAAAADLSVLPGAAVDPAGNSSIETLADQIINDAQTPIVISIAADKADGFYKAGEIIDFTVAYSEPVIVDTAGGTPAIGLNSDGDALYSAGSGTTDLVFRYTIGNNQNSTDLDYLSPLSLKPAGGVIKDQADNLADNILPAVGTIGDSRDIAVDTVAPTVSAGSNRTANALFTQTGAATDINLAQIAWSKISGSGSIVFGTPSAAATTIQADTNGNYVIRLTAADRAGNAAYSDMNLIWDSQPPVVSISSPIDGELYSDAPVASYAITASTTAPVETSPNSTNSNPAPAGSSKPTANPKADIRVTAPVKIETIESPVPADDVQPSATESDLNIINPPTDDQVKGASAEDDKPNYLPWIVLLSALLVSFFGWQLLAQIKTTAKPADGKLPPRPIDAKPAWNTNKELDKINKPQQKKSKH